jgi:hypothetical protein
MGCSFGSLEIGKIAKEFSGENKRSKIPTTKTFVFGCSEIG